LSLFKAILDRSGQDAMVHDMNILFAGQIGWANYRCADKRIHLVDIMNSLWAPFAWGGAFHAKSEELLALCKAAMGSKNGTESMVPWLQKIRDAVIPEFLRKAHATLLDFGSPQVIAFSCISAPCNKAG
jgi:hypothetical protein